MTQTYQKYNVATNKYITSQNIPREKRLNGFTATNIGDTPFFINDVLLGPPVPPAVVGDSVSFGGNENEIFVDRIVLSFVLPLGANPNCQISQKYFVDSNAL